MTGRNRADSYFGFEKCSFIFISTPLLTIRLVTGRACVSSGSGPFRAFVPVGTHSATELGRFRLRSFPLGETCKSRRHRQESLPLLPLLPRFRCHCKSWPLRHRHYRCHHILRSPSFTFSSLPFPSHSSPAPAPSPRSLPLLLSYSKLLSSLSLPLLPPPPRSFLPC